MEGALDKNQRFHARLSGSYLNNDGLSLDHEAWPRLKDASEQSQVSARLSYRPDGKGISDDNNSNNDSRLVKNSQYC